MANRIFINYRRDDSSGTAGRLYDRLAEAFGSEDLFMDVEHIPAGVDFVAYLNAQVAACDVFLAVIGPDWLDATDTSGRRRLENPDDFVAVEIAAALARNIRVVPVLIDGARMPKADALPEPLKPFSRRNAVEVRNSQFRRDADALIDNIRQAFPGRRAGLKRRWPLIAAGVAALTLVGGAVAYLADVPLWPWQEAEQTARRDPALGVTPGSGQSFRDRLANGQSCSTCPEMIVVPGGSFTMGSPAGERGRQADEGPQHQVNIVEPFAVAKFSVTRGEFAAFANETDRTAEGGCEGWTGSDWNTRQDRSWRSPGFPQDDRHPVVCVNWNDANAFTAWLSQKTGKPYRLLTEAEWEYAARAGKATRFFFGDDEKDFCRYGNGADLTAQKRNPSWAAALPCDDGQLYTAPAGSFQPNAFGLYDMLGNAMQWVEDCYNDSYRGAPEDGSAWLAGDCSQRVRRGGSWFRFAPSLRSAFRGLVTRADRASTGSFRLARSLAP